MILALGRWRQEDREFEASVSYTVTYIQGQLKLYEHLSQTTQKEWKEGREGGKEGIKGERKGMKQERWKEGNAIPKGSPLTFDPQNCDPKSLCLGYVVLVIKRRWRFTMKGSYVVLSLQSNKGRGWRDLT